VREYIQFAADLRLDGTLQERTIEVDRTIKILHLEKCQNTFIGDSTSRGISGKNKYLQKKKKKKEKISKFIIFFLLIPQKRWRKKASFNLNRIACLTFCTLPR